MPKELLGKSLIVKLFRIQFVLLFSFNYSFVFLHIVFYFVLISNNFLLSKITGTMTSKSRRTNPTKTVFVWSIIIIIQSSLILHLKKEELNV